MPLGRASGEIDAPVGEVWSGLTDFANPQRLAPAIASGSATGEGVGAVRVVQSARGLLIQERLLECDAEVGRFRYEVLDIGDMPLAGITRYECTVTLQSLPGDRTAIEWSSSGSADRAIGPITEFLDALYARAKDSIQAAIGRGAAN